MLRISRILDPGGLPKGTGQDPFMRQDDPRDETDPTPADVQQARKTEKALLTDLRMPSGGPKAGLYVPWTCGSVVRVSRILMGTEDRYKYPRTFHIPGSPGATSDDKVLSSMAHFEGQEVVITEKMDGENTTIYPDAMHARSLDGKNHPSRDWVKKLQSEIGYQIPQGMRICGENVFAKHSIGYEDLPSYFLVFSIWEGAKCLSWEETEFYCNELGLHTVPVLYKGVFDEKNLEKKFFKGTSAYGGDQEGFVIRLARSFSRSEFNKALAKWVRPNHVQTDEHWMNQKITPNKVTAPR